MASESEPVELAVDDDGPTGLVCRRCGLLFDPLAVRCPHCGAGNRAVEVPTAHRRNPLNVVLAFYAILLVTSVVHAMVLWTHRNNPTDETQVAIHAGASAVDVLIVFAALAFAGRVEMPGRLRASRLIVVWLASLPILAILLGLNFVYFAALRNYLGLDASQFEHLPLTAANVLLLCVMPAIFEELFFRHLALGAFRGVMGPGAAVVLSAALFALAHLYNPLGMPYLFLCGVVFGFARVWGGGLLLPMLLHFLHNFAVCFHEAFA